MVQILCVKNIRFGIRRYGVAFIGTWKKPPTSILKRLVALRLNFTQTAQLLYIKP